MIIVETIKMLKAIAVYAICKAEPIFI